MTPDASGKFKGISVPSIPWHDELQTVWVVEPVGYDCYGIEGIYDSLEAAKASRPDYEWVEDDDSGDSWTSAGASVVRAMGSAIYRWQVETLESVLAGLATNQPRAKR